MELKIYPCSSLSVLSSKRALHASAICSSLGLPRALVAASAHAPLLPHRREIVGQTLKKSFDREPNWRYTKRMKVSVFTFALP